MDSGLADALDVFGSGCGTCKMFDMLSADMLGCYRDTLLDDQLANLNRYEEHHDVLLGSSPLLLCGGVHEPEQPGDIRTSGSAGAGCSMNLVPSSPRADVLPATADSHLHGLCCGDPGGTPVLPGATGVAILDADTGEDSCESLACTMQAPRGSGGSDCSHAGALPTPFTVPLSATGCATGRYHHADTQHNDAACRAPSALVCGVLAVGSPRASDMDSLQSMQSCEPDAMALAADSAVRHSSAAAALGCARPHVGGGGAPRVGMLAVRSVNSLDCASAAGSPHHTHSLPHLVAVDPRSHRAVPAAAVGVVERRVSGRARRATSVYAPYQLNSARGKSDGRSAPLCKLTPNPNGGACTSCGATVTPVWRAGPAGPKTLCNACGVRYMKNRDRK